MNSAWWRQKAVKPEHTAHRHSKQQQQLPQHKSPRPRGADGSAFVACPVCGQQVPLVTVNQHLDGPCPGPVCSRAPEAQAVAEYDTGPVGADQATLVVGDPGADPYHPGGGGGGALAHGADEVSAVHSLPQHSLQQHESGRMAADSPAKGTPGCGSAQALQEGSRHRTDTCTGAHPHAVAPSASDVAGLGADALDGDGDAGIDEVVVVEAAAGWCQATGAAGRSPAGPMDGAHVGAGVGMMLRPNTILGSADVCGAGMRTADSRDACPAPGASGTCVDQAAFGHHAKRRRLGQPPLLEQQQQLQQQQQQPPGALGEDLVAALGQAAGTLPQAGCRRSGDYSVKNLLNAGRNGTPQRVPTGVTGPAPLSADSQLSPVPQPCATADDGAGQDTAEAGLRRGKAGLAAAAPVASAAASSGPIDTPSTTTPEAAEWWRAAALRQRKQQQLHALQRPAPATSIHSEHQAQQLHTEAAVSPGPAVPALPPGVGPPGPDGMLRPVPHTIPEGGFLLPCFVSPEEEQAIVALCDDPRQAPPWQWVTRGTSTHVRAKRWGVLPDYGRRGVVPAQHPLPPPLVALAERMRTHVALLRDFRPNEANALDYWREKGSVLHPHADDRILSTDIIVTLSLVGRAVMTFELDKGREAERRASRARVHLPPRCLQILSGRARYNYTHGITNGDLLDPRRVSITFRHSPLKPYEKEL